MNANLRNCSQFENLFNSHKFVPLVLKNYEL